jgi:hypothetical protein
MNKSIIIIFNSLNILFSKSLFVGTRGWIGVFHIYYKYRHIYVVMNEFLLWVL